MTIVSSFIHHHGIVIVEQRLLMKMMVSNMFSRSCNILMIFVFFRFFRFFKCEVSKRRFFRYVIGLD